VIESMAPGDSCCEYDFCSGAGSLWLAAADAAAGGSLGADCALKLCGFAAASLAASVPVACGAEGYVGSLACSANMSTCEHYVASSCRKQVGSSVGRSAWHGWRPGCVSRYGRRRC
jgi:hypothetical protein